MGIFSDIATHGGAQTIQTIRIIPEARSSARNGQHLDLIAREVGDRFYFAGVEVAKLCYKEIDARYPNRLHDRAQEQSHAEKFHWARTILNEHRNLIFEAVLPMFEVRRRTATTELTEADKHARDYFIGNVFYMMSRTFLDCLPKFVEPHKLDELKQVVANVAQTQSDKLEAELKNYAFRFRPVVEPPRP